ncbi:MAG TPA: sugar transferase [Terracidiphilus sp.]|jgi:lipopolysaccharide/colanic/teichoic acid biosynthesis glycosyltransferase|nr:sugar transferase [Terracidiphilus sp.]
MVDCEPPECPPASEWVDSRTRRILDCSVALLALVLMLPILAVCWALVRFTSPGPVLFRQRRMGRDGKEFELYKFRSMWVDGNTPGASHTVHADCRLTPVGALLRRYKLDELPQFWNVLKGEMSLVGPRPKLPEHEALHMPYCPGLTGEATLAFRHEEHMLLEIPPGNIESFYQAVLKPIKAKMDVSYMQRATCASDLRIVMRTFFLCLNCVSNARRELEELLEEHAPESLGALCPLHVPSARLSPPRAPVFIPELVDEFANDMDDA